MQRTRILVVDDSVVVRKLLSDALSSEPDLEVVGHAADPYMARDLIARTSPDVVTLDLEMPRMDGLTFLSKLMEHHPLPVITVSSLTQQGSAMSVAALQLGAIDVFAKPGGPHSVRELADRLKQRIRALRASPPVRLARRERLDEAPPVQHQRPAVDVLFSSAARVTVLPLLGVLLTGMGADRADGMVALRQAGAETLAEAEESCVVFGMPREAIARGGASQVVPLLQMPSAIADGLERMNRARAA